MFREWLDTVNRTLLPTFVFFLFSQSFYFPVSFSFPSKPHLILVALGNQKNKKAAHLSPVVCPPELTP